MSVQEERITKRRSRPEVFCKKGVLRNFTKFTGKHLCQSLFFNKVAGLRHHWTTASVFLGISCGLSAPYIGGQLMYCLSTENVIPVIIGFNPVDLARSSKLISGESFQTILNHMISKGKVLKICLIRSLIC